MGTIARAFVVSIVTEIPQLDCPHTSLLLDNEYSDDTVGEDGVNASMSASVPPLSIA